MKSVKIQGQSRADVGKKSSNALRNEGQVPCVLYGGDDVIHFSAPVSEFNDLLQSPAFVTASISVDGKEYNAVVKDMQFHPVTDALLHIDFLELVAGKPIVAEVPIQIEGRAKGVAAGGKLLTKVRKLKVKATPDNLEEYITVNVTNLGLNKSIKVKDLKAKMTGMEIMHPDGMPVASVITPRTLRTAGAAAGEEEEGEAEATEAEGGESTETSAEG